MKRIVLIPAYEPGTILKTLVSDLKRSGFEIVIVDDGSGKKYIPVFEKLKDAATVISYDENHGKGYALKTGFRYIYNRNTEAVIVTMDSDGQHLVSDAEKLCQELECCSADLVIGTRILPKNAPTRSRIGNEITRKVFKTVTGVKVYDTQSGLRAFRNDLLPFLMDIPGDRYEYEMNVLLSMAKQKKTMKEVPIRTIYFDKKNSVSHFNAVKDSVKIYKEILKFAGNSFFCFLLDYGVYSLILMLAGSGAILAANIIARAVSSCVNFTVNKKIVFASKGNYSSEAVKYFGLVIFNLCVNSMILTFLTGLGLSAYVSKIITEMMMFVFSYVVQCTFIFRKGENT